MNFTQELQQALDVLRAQGNLRHLPRLEHDGRYITTPDDGRRMLNLSSNDYLGLAADTDLRREFLDNIVKEYIQDKPVMECVTPMVRDEAALDAAHEEITQRLCQELDQGKNVAFITLGDPSVYSTYYYIHCRVQKRGYEAQLIPGVPSFCAVAARLNKSLCERSERLMIVPASHKDISDCLETDANLVFMKAGKEIGVLQNTLREKGLIDRASLVANCGMEGEQVWEHFDDMPENTGYFSVVVVKRGDSSADQDGRD